MAWGREPKDQDSEVSGSQSSVASKLKKTAPESP